MTIAAPTRLITVDELMRLGSDARVEVVNGEIVKMTPLGGLHHFVAGNIYDTLKPFVKERELGFVFFDGLIYLLSTELGFAPSGRIGQGVNKTVE